MPVENYSESQENDPHHEPVLEGSGDTEEMGICPHCDGPEEWTDMFGINWCKELYWGVENG